MWVKIDDHFDDDPDIDRVGIEAGFLFICSLSCAARLQTDGLLEINRVRRLPGGTQRNIEKLIEAGWFISEPFGIRIRNFLKYNPSKAEVEALSNERSNAGRAGGLRSGMTRKLKSSEARASANGSASASTLEREQTKQK